MMVSTTVSGKLHPRATLLKSKAISKGDERREADNGIVGLHENYRDYVWHGQVGDVDIQPKFVVIAMKAAYAANPLSCYAHTRRDENWVTPFVISTKQNAQFFRDLLIRTRGIFTRTRENDVGRARIQYRPSESMIPEGCRHPPLSVYVGTQKIPANGSPPHNFDSRCPLRPGVQAKADCSFLNIAVHFSYQSKINKWSIQHCSLRFRIRFRH